VHCPPTSACRPTASTSAGPTRNWRRNTACRNHKVYAALAYARANRLNRIVFDSPRPRLGIIACGKAYLDVRQALDDLGIDDRARRRDRPAPVQGRHALAAGGRSVRRFAEGLEEILVVEEKRQIIEYQLKEMLYNWREDVRPRVSASSTKPANGRRRRTRWLLPPTGELTPAIVARAIAARIGRFHTSPRIRDAPGLPRGQGTGAGESR
jgi:indolepyruvate ferredoxin oxidoreductase